MSVSALRHAGIVVTDLERSLAFYVDLLGLEVARRMDEHGAYLDTMLALDGARVTTVKLGAPDGGLVELLRFERPAPRAAARTLHDVGPTHVALTVRDLDGLHRRLREAGTEFYSEPVVSPDGRAKVVFCRDPDGTPLELVEELG